MIMECSRNIDRDALRIAIVVGGFPTLSETFVLDHIASMLGRGHDVTVFPASSSIDMREAHPDYGRLRLERLVRRPLGLPDSRGMRYIRRYILMMRHGLRSPAIAARSMNVLRYGMDALNGHLFHTAIQFGLGTRYDVIHAHFGWSGRPAQIMRDLGAVKGPLITSFHGSDITVGYRPGKHMYGDLWQKGDLFTANSSYTSMRMTQDGCPSDRLILWPMGANSDFFSVPARNINGPFRIVGVGRLAPVKGWDIAIRALSLLPVDCSLHLVGGGSGEEYVLRSLVRQLGLENRVVFHGSLTRDRVKDIMAECLVFVLPGRIAGDGSVEAQGVAIAEAQANGLPAIVGDLGGMPDSIRPGESGLLFPAGDYGALAACCMKLYTDRGLIGSMAGAAVRHARDNFDQRRQYDNIELIYRRVARRWNEGGALRC